MCLWYFNKTVCGQPSSITPLALPWLTVALVWQGGPFCLLVLHFFGTTFVSGFHCCCVSTSAWCLRYCWAWAEPPLMESPRGCMGEVLAREQARPCAHDMIRALKMSVPQVASRIRSRKSQLPKSNPEPKHHYLQNSPALNVKFGTLFTYFLWQTSGMLQADVAFFSAGSTTPAILHVKGGSQFYF